jgi:hypothetical protein
MNIYSKPGNKIKYDRINAGHTHEQELCKTLLKLNNIYTVYKTVVHSYSSIVYLKEFPNIKFNTVMFSDIEKDSNEY